MSILLVLIYLMVTLGGCRVSVRETEQLSPASPLMSALATDAPIADVASIIDANPGIIASDEKSDVGKETGGPLLVAAFGQRTNVVTLLLDHGADPDRAMAYCREFFGDEGLKAESLMLWAMEHDSRTGEEENRE